MLNSKLLGGTAAGKTYIEDVFSTWLYAGNGSSQTITNGIDLSGKGGLVWLKSRNYAGDNNLFDTARGAGDLLISNSTAAAGAGYGLSFLSDGFSLSAQGNAAGYTYASWTFRKAAKFFDVVTYTGNGSTKTINHNLGSVPGCIIIKQTSASGENWCVYHRSLGNTTQLFLNTTTAAGTNNSIWGATTPTSTHFTVGPGSPEVNGSGATYVAYLFAHDTGADGLIQCGSFTTNGSGAATVSLGWEPQWVLFKRTGSAQSWYMLDSMRGLSLANNQQLLADTNGAELAYGGDNYPTSTGFYTSNTFGTSQNVIYIAIRRGPMRTPTDASKVFSTVTQTVGSTSTPAHISGFPVDFSFRRVGLNTTGTNTAQARLTGTTRLFTSNTNAEGSEASNKFDYMNGFFLEPSASTNNIAWMFRRAPGFFDVVAYTGTGSARTVSHNLGVAPELMIIKHRSDLTFTSSNRDWAVYLSVAGGVDKYMFLNRSDLQYTGGGVLWNNTVPTSSVFSLDGNVIVNYSAATYIAYLFATCPGVSKVGSYTGTGTTLQVNCGFTAGARFVLIKRTDSTGDWYVWDTARGIVSGNDPSLLLNSTAAEVTNTDYIDPLNSGFEISSTAPAAINANGGTFIYLAIA